MIDVPGEFSKENFLKMISYLLDAGGVREFNVDRRPENRIIELTLLVTPQANKTGKLAFHSESFEPIRTHLAKMPNLDVKNVGVTESCRLRSIS